MVCLSQNCKYKGYEINIHTKPLYFTPFVEIHADCPELQLKTRCCNNSNEAYKKMICIIKTYTGDVI